MKKFLKTYGQAILMIAAILIGSLLGMGLGEKAEVIKPFGDIFINLLFTIVVPLVFFSIASAIANLKSGGHFKKIVNTMLVVFLITTVLSALLMILGVKMFPPAEGVTIELAQEITQEKPDLGTQIVKAITVDNFIDLFKRENMLPLIIFSILVGFATRSVGEVGIPFKKLLDAGAQICMKFVSYIMYYAPIGIAAYFANIVGTFGSSIVTSYVRSLVLYTVLALIYFVVAFSLYAFISGGRKGVFSFWKNNLLPSATAIGTQSSVATIPANMQATMNMGVSKEVRETVIPFAASIHKDGSSMGAILKIAFAFGVMGTPFEGFGVYVIAILVAIMTAIIMGGIPGGGLMGEMFIISIYGFSPAMLPLLAIISTIIDIPATLLNATGDNTSAMMVERYVNKKPVTGQQ